MDLYFTHEDPTNTVLVSANGVAHYQIRTNSGKPKISVLQRPAETEEESLVAEIEWRRWDAPTVVRSPLLGGGLSGELMGTTGGFGFGVLLSRFLVRKSRFGRSRYFVGNDKHEYRWKCVKGVGLLLTHVGTNEEVACFSRAFAEEGLFAGEKRAVLHIHPTTLDIDLIILTFLIMEKKRRDRSGDGTRAPYDEDPLGDGCMSGGEAGEA
ncbi:hypothetical protein AMATHDRAFT_2195 [Amanita thiersii Skay4041]|uniref:DUF6593 domain-containing protein n=1 Tax=Amanita thiersii Skay4041 TaxID=703135 RepID=A0A2A9NXI0_9AGAR|nr:hypothetical protein AMATHDRAFT_2195 [Amanita thiersii Skay4041]